MVKKNKKNKRDSLQVYGINGSYNILQTHKISILQIDIMIGGVAEKKKWVKKILDQKKLPIQNIPKQQFLLKYRGKRTQGIVIRFADTIIKKIPSFSKGKDSICLLTIDGLEDPQNLGQIIRTSECAGINGLLIPKHGNVQTTNSVLQVSQGAFVHLPLYQCGNLHQTLRSLKKEGFWVIGFENSINSSRWFEFDYNKKIIIIMGSEGKGIRPIIRKTCDELLTIPMQGCLNSLNVSASVSAVLFERNRQLLQKSTIKKN